MSKVPIERKELPSSADFAVHSDYLIHWTGWEIDADHHPNWYDEHRHGKTDSNKLIELYLDRLKNILTYGLWMTQEKDARTFRIGSKNVVVPPTPQCCFTELKLSESRRHAYSYGRLGLGVKRKFLFERFGRPLAYFGFGEQKNKDKFLEECTNYFKADNADKLKLLNFFKPMNKDTRRLNDNFYGESEWRILHFKELEADGKIVDPRNSANKEHHAYFNSLSQDKKDKLKYLIPLDGWFSMIIYPSLKIKNRAQWNEENGIRGLIKAIKSKPGDDGNRVEGPEDPRKGNWPIEVDLDACRNF
jgi:hypothetical protein